MTDAQRHEALTVSIRQLTEGMADARDRCLAASERGDHRTADFALASYERMKERREYLQARLEELETVLSN
ncbi:hypothetical protein [Tautonia rosea]|uniref:hypothetical protein n=1 Tax=Tautonia rosea TaxID=2728037 RepID=UPI001475D320|nr:hypothetical protein [Tautonia rosea]